MKWFYWLASSRICIDRHTTVRVRRRTNNAANTWRCDKVRVDLLPLPGSPVTANAIPMLLTAEAQQSPLTWFLRSIGRSDLPLVFLHPITSPLNLFFHLDRCGGANFFWRSIIIYPSSYPFTCRGQ